MCAETVLSDIAQEEAKSISATAGSEIAGLIDPETLVGELLSINFSEAQVLVHDYRRQKVRGLPHGSFLVATRMNLETLGENDAEDEDVDNVPIEIDPRDFIARRTFYGGMSRGGKEEAGNGQGAMRICHPIALLRPRVFRD